MKPEIKLIFSPNVADLETWCPSDPEDVYVLLQLEIGTVGVPGGDFFQVILATLAVLRKHRRRGERPAPRHCWW